VFEEVKIVLSLLGFEKIFLLPTLTPLALLVEALIVG
jgi:hypothetical protein